MNETIVTRFACALNDMDRRTYAVLLIATGVAFGAHANRVSAAPEVKLMAPESLIMSVAQLEQAFWICDHAAAKGMIDRDSAVICGGVTDELKSRKFSGDFDRMVTWWRQNKPAQQSALDNADCKNALMMQVNNEWDSLN